MAAPAAAGLVALLALGAAAGADLSAWEQLFASVPSPKEARASLWHYTRRPHVAGTAGDRELAFWTRDRLREMGLSSEVQAVPVLQTLPLESSLSVLSPAPFAAKLAEDFVSEDETSGSWWRNHTWNGYSPSGEVLSAPLVYVNYGTLEDYAELEALNISVRGKVVIARYGQAPGSRRMWRGLKPKLAEERGAVGCLIFSDPSEDGYCRGEVYPRGPWKPPSAVQRGSVLYWSRCGGDPSRSYLNQSVEEVCGYKVDDLMPKIPTMPLSYSDALPMLDQLAGPPAPSAFQGGLPISYRIGSEDTPVLVRMKVVNLLKKGPIWNVQTTIPGSLPQELDRPVVLANHRDAWVYGAADPHSGSATALEVARGFSELLRKGWRPQRTVILNSWSGEEPGRLGSTAWAELNSAMLSERAVAYLNVDVAVTGRVFIPQGSPVLKSLVRSAAEKVLDPVSGKSIVESWDGSFPALGDGSDYTAFVDHLGIASVDFAFSGDYGVYHSIFDSFHWMEKFGDPNFTYHAAAAQVWGLMAMELADAPVLPFNHTEVAGHLGGYLADLGLAFLGPAWRSRCPTGSHEPEEGWLAPLYEAVARYGEAAARVAAEAAKAQREPRTAAQLAELNDRLALAERRFLLPGGLPGRKWFRHALQAPSNDRGYAFQTLPALAEPLRDCDAKTAAAGMAATAAAVTRAAEFLSGGSLAAAERSTARPELREDVVV